MKRFLSILLVVSIIFVMLSAQGFVSYGSIATTNNGLSDAGKVIIEDCNEIKLGEEQRFMSLFDNRTMFKFIPDVDGIYTYTFKGTSYISSIRTTLYDQQSNAVGDTWSNERTRDFTLSAGNVYYIEIYTYSGDVMTSASVTVDLKEEIVEVTPPPTETPTISPTQEPEFEYEVLDNGKAAITKYSGSDASVIIPDELDGHTVNTIRANAFANYENIINILIPESVTTIEKNAFYETRPGGVFYPGRKEKWDDISIGDGNIYLKSAIRFYNYNGSVPDGNDPVIGISAFYDNAYKNKQYTINVDAYNLTSLENASVIMKYNPEVLKLNEENSLIRSEERLYEGGYSILSEGNIRIGVSRNETWLSFGGDSILDFNLCFDVIGAGDTGLTVELENVNYRSDSRLQVIASNFAKLAESDESEPEPTDTICPTETPTPEPFETPTICPTPEPTIGSTETIEQEILLGDINGDEKVNAEDALLALQSAAKLIELTESESKVGDANVDGRVDAEDALTILKIAAELIEK